VIIRKLQAQNQLLKERVAELERQKQS